MAATPRILLVDDGELDDVAQLLGKLDLPYTRLRGGEIRSNIAPPRDLLIATPRRSSSVEAGSPEGAKPGRPVRVIVTEEDSNSMRRMLRRAGFQLLVRRPTHPEIWRLLIQRAIYQGDERRRDIRLPMGSDVHFAPDSVNHSALMLDASVRGCRVACALPLARGSVVEISVPCSSADGLSLELAGEVVRCEPGDGQGFVAALAFGSLAEETQQRLNVLLGAVAAGPGSLAATRNAVMALPRDPAEETEGENTEASVLANVEVSVRTEQRQHARGAYTRSVLAEAGSNNSVLMGRDLSAGGMRVERLPHLQEGDRFSLAIYGPARSEPLRVNAVVSRDDGEEGLALRFQNVSDATGRELEKLVATLPDVESLDESESASMGAVLSEIVA